jgi:hypothetical protein
MILLTTPTPVPSPALPTSLDPVQVTAWATVILAGAAILSFIASIYLAVRTGGMASATRDLADSTRRGLELQEKELNLLAAEHDENRRLREEATRAAQPRLRCDVLTFGDSEVTGRVIWVAGSLAAVDVVVLLQGRGRFFHRGAATRLESGDCPLEYRAGPTGDEAVVTTAFPEWAANVPSAPSDWWAGVMWTSPDGRRRRWSQRWVQSAPTGDPVEDRD